MTVQCVSLRDLCDDEETLNEFAASCTASWGDNAYSLVSQSLVRDTMEGIDTKAASKAISLINNLPAEVYIDLES
jgi:hypothetical protein